VLRPTGEYALLIINSGCFGIHFLAIYGPIYTALYLMVLMHALVMNMPAGIFITRAGGRVLGPENQDFFGSCEMALNR
jgi:hypothetical protein